MPEPVYLMLVASERPLRLDRIQRQAGFLRSRLGFTKFASFHAPTTMDALVRSVVPDHKGEDWVTDYWVILPPLHAPRALASTAYVRCPNGGVAVLAPGDPFAFCPRALNGDRERPTIPGDTALPPDSAGTDPREPDVKDPTPPGGRDPRAGRPKDAAGGSRATGVEARPHAEGTKRERIAEGAIEPGELERGRVRPFAPPSPGWRPERQQVPPELMGGAREADRAEPRWRGAGDESRREPAGGRDAGRPAAASGADAAPAPRREEPAARPRVEREQPAPESKIRRPEPAERQAPPPRAEPARIEPRSAPAPRPEPRAPDAQGVKGAGGQGAGRPGVQR
jgi:hypothetical protein